MCQGRAGDGLKGEVNCTSDSVLSTEWEGSFSPGSWWAKPCNCLRSNSRVWVWGRNYSILFVYFSSHSLFLQNTTLSKTKSRTKTTQGNYMMVNNSHWLPIAPAPKRVCDEVAITSIKTGYACHLLWENTYCEPYLVRIICGKWWSHFLFISKRSRISTLQAQSPWVLRGLNPISNDFLFSPLNF